MNAIAPSSAPATGPALDNRRVLAALVDIGVVVLGTVLLTTLIGMLVGGITWGPQMGLVTAAWALYYYFALESGDGQTLGKKVMNLRVVRADGGATTMREIAVRTVLRLVDGIALYLVGLVVMIITGERRQRLGDLAAGTIVVDAAGAPAPAAPAAAGAVALPPSDRSFPVATTQADGMAAPEQVTSFNPFGSPVPAAEEEPTYAPAASSEPLAVEPSEAPAPTPEPVAEEPTYEPPPPAAPEPTEEDPAAAEPTIEPYPYSEVPAEEPEVGEPAPAPTFGHGPVDEAATQSEIAEPTAEEPESAEPVAEEPEVEEPVAAQSDVAESEIEEPEVHEPAAEEPQDADQDPEAAPEDTSDEAASVEPASAADSNGVGREADPDVKVRSVETVSAMDLIMGEDDEDDSRPSPGDGSAA